MKKEYRICWPFFVFSLALLTLVAKNAVSQTYPPAQGPPLPENEVSRWLRTSQIINTMKDSIQVMLDSLNAEISRDAESTGIQAHLSFTATTHEPLMSTTKYPDRPNENIVWIPFIISYDVTGIRYHGVFYFSRKISQSIDVLVSCNNWFTNQGKLRITFNADRPHLEGPSFSEEVLNFFISHTLTDKVDNKLRQKLPNAITTIIDLHVIGKCNCLGVYAGEGPDYDDGWIEYYEKRLLPPPSVSIINVPLVTVTFESIKRLPAHTTDLDILYNEVEDIQLVFYANQKNRTAQLLAMREGDERNLMMEVVRVGKLADNASLVLICNVEQLSFSAKDTQFKVFTSKHNFGKGTKKITVKKTYWEPPQPINGGMSKPTLIPVDAYEITVRIAAEKESFRKER